MWGAGVAGALFAGTVAMVLGALGISCFLVFQALMVAGWGSQPLLGLPSAVGLGSVINLWDAQNGLHPEAAYRWALG